MDLPLRSSNNTASPQGRRRPEDSSSTLKQNRVSTGSPSPLSSAPPTPTVGNAPPTPTSARRTPSQLRHTASSPRLSTASPSLNRRASRSSLSMQSPADGADKRLTPKRSISNLISGLREAQATMEPIVEPVVLTAPDVAKLHFARELERMEQDNEAEALVVLHDACYGHRFSRPKTSKGNLSMIVERPERLHAGVLGAATAFVRMGEHYQGGVSAPHPEKKLEGPPPFKIRRTAREMDVTSPCVTSVHGTAWMSELKTMTGLAGERLAKGEKELQRTRAFDGSEKRTLHQGDLYLCQESLDAFRGALGGVADAVDAVFSPQVSTKRAFVAVRPPGHHCSADYPSGFCWLNNVHVGLEYAAQTHNLTHAAIIDFDLHHGDGSQSITWARNAENLIKRQNARNNKQKLSPDIGYYSLHDINSYPCEMGDDEKVQAASLCVENAHCQSVWNVHLQPWKTEDDFWDLYESRYRVLIDKARVFLRHHTSRLRAEGKVQPKAALFISAGFDASEHEGEGMQRHKVNVPTEFYARFTRDMVKLAQEAESGCDGRVISVLEGGYSDRALCSGVLSHLSGLCGPLAAKSALPATRQSSLGLSMQSTNGAFDLEQQLNGLSLHNDASEQGYDTRWWSTANLAALEMRIKPPPPQVQSKKLRAGPQPTYATPTESFAYKVVDAQKFARSVSGTMRERDTSAALGREAKIIVHEVDWVTATQELSKLLIPHDRQTKSCTAEELAGPKVEKRTPAPAAHADAEKPRQLRTRAAAVKPAPRAESSDRRPEQPRAVSRTDRRRTIADLPSNTEAIPYVPPRRTSRRSSMASSLSTPSSEPNGYGAPPPIPPQVPPVPSSMEGMKPPPKPLTMNGGMQVKKTRAPPAKPALARKETAPNSAPVSPAVKTKPAVAIVPSASTIGTFQLAASSQTSTDLDALVSKTSKLRLNAPASKEEHERKLKEKLAAERRASALKGAETRRVNAAARKAKDAAAPLAGGPSAAPGAGLTPAQRAKMGPLARSDVASAVAEPQQLPPVQHLGTQEQTGGGAVNGISAAMLSAPQLQPDQQQAYPLAVPGAPLIEPAVTSPPPAPIIPSASVFEAPAELAPPAPPPLPLPSGNLPSALPFTAPPAAFAAATSSPLPPLSAQRIPDSAAKQLLHEQDLASHTFAEIEDTPVRPSSKSANAPLPVFSATGVIPFAAQTQQPVEAVPAQAVEMGAEPQHRRLTSLENGNGVSRSMHDRLETRGNVEMGEKERDI